MPKLGLTMTEGTLSEWLVGPGDGFARGDILFVVETDKIANEIEAEDDGRLTEIIVPAGATADVGAVLATVTFDHLPAGTPVGSQRDPVSPYLATDAPPPSGGGSSADADRPAPHPTGERVVATPLARRLAREMGVDLSTVSGSGPRGRIKSDDVRRAGQTASAGGAGTIPHSAVSSRSGPSPADLRQGTPVPLSRPQLVAAHRTSLSKSTIPHFYVTATVSMDVLMALREKINGDQSWPKTTLTHWMVAAIGRALADMPTARRVWQSDGAVEFDGIAVGVVADIGGDLFIPVLHDVGSISVGAVAAGLDAVIGRARDGKLRREDMGGAAISLSNLGMYGIDSVIPVIDADQGMIMGVGKISRTFRPDESGAPVAVSETVLTLACDHRVHNGVVAAKFLGRVAAYLQEPLRLLMPPVIS